MLTSHCELPVLCGKCNFCLHSLEDLPSPNPLSQLYRQDPGVSDWPEQVEFHPYSVDEESELGYMDDPYQEETYEDLLTPAFCSLERDALQMVEVTHSAITKAV